MIIRSTPDAVEKLAQMGEATRYEPAGDQPQRESTPRDQSNDMLGCIAHVATPKGSKPILKTMITTACEKNCYYCPFRAGRSSTRRVTFQPDELAQTFDRMQQARLVDGLFLSSGIIRGGVTMQDKIIDTAEIIRRKYGYRGYVHLKIMPGAQYDQVRRAMQLADRVSINLEGPTQERLSQLAPKKDFSGELLERLQWAHLIRQREPGIKASITTQFVVGAVGDTDLELLSLSERLYNQTGLARAYYMAFSPILDTPFENVQAVDPRREFRLYQSSFLLRDYGWDVEDLPFAGDGNLPTDIDPKRAWADRHLREAPVEIMQASRQALMRIPGIGPRGADAILRARRQGSITEFTQLRALGIRAPEQIAPYVLLNGHKPPTQLSLL
ncbi:MAG: radical SAM protein [Anaerolineae bacterium]|nr:radical SAM protein [Anaerolineae bacterium]